MKVLKAITYITAGITFVFVLFVCLSEKADFFACPIWLVFACSAVYLVVYYGFSHERIRQKRNEKVRFRDLVDAEIDKDFRKRWRKSIRNPMRGI